MFNKDHTIQTRDQFTDHVQQCFDILSSTMMLLHEKDHMKTPGLHGKQKAGLTKFIVDVKNRFGIDLNVDEKVKHYYCMYDDKELGVMFQSLLEV